MGLCMLDFMLMNDQFPAIVEAFNKVEIVKEENDASLEDFSENLFRNLTVQLRRKTRLEPTVAFVKSLQELPEIGLVLSKYAFK